MNTELVERLQKTRQALEPRVRALRAATAALAEALKLAGEEKADALPMQKTLLKLQGAAEGVDDEALRDATAPFQAKTERAPGVLAFEFARDLREAFQARGLEVAGRPDAGGRRPDPQPRHGRIGGDPLEVSVVDAYSGQKLARTDRPRPIGEALLMAGRPVEVAWRDRHTFAVKDGRRGAAIEAMRLLRAKRAVPLELAQGVALTLGVGAGEMPLVEDANVDAKVNSEVRLFHFWGDLIRCVAGGDDAGILHCRRTLQLLLRRPFTAPSAGAPGLATLGRRARWKRSRRCSLSSSRSSSWALSSPAAGGEAAGSARGVRCGALRAALPRREP